MTLDKIRAEVSYIKVLRRYDRDLALERYEVLRNRIANFILKHKIVGQRLDKLLKEVEADL